jgi:hypothetical protein
VQASLSNGLHMALELICANIYPIGIDGITEHASPYRRHLERLVRPYVQATRVPEDTVR